MAQDYFPLTNQQAEEKGYSWREEGDQEFLEATYVPPNRIDEVEDSVIQERLKCEECGKNYRIVAQELKFYRQMGLPLPTSCFFCRHQRRLKSRNPRHLYDRNCDKCGVKIETTYPPAGRAGAGEQEEKVYCEKCYQESLN